MYTIFCESFVPYGKYVFDPMVLTWNKCFAKYGHIIIDQFFVKISTKQVKNLPLSLQ